MQSQITQQDTQIDPLETVRSDADERTPAPKFAKISPLARAALANGVSFEDVQAYCEACETRPDLFALLSVSLGAGVDALAEEQLNSDFLDAALARSVLAEGTIEHARLWWRGVL